MNDDDRAKRRALLTRHFLLRDVPEKVLDDLIGFSTTRRYADDEVIFAKGDDGDGLYGILEGQVRIFSGDAEGREITLNILDTGELFGEIALIDGKSRSADAAAIGTTTLFHMPRRHFVPYLRQSPDLCFSLLEILCARVRWTSSVIEDRAFLGLEARLAKWLLNLANDELAGRNNVVRLRMKLSQRELGALVGTSREAVNKQFALWRDNGLISIERGMITLHSPDQLRALVDLA
ncbi:Crp/Fnr family transcriptional regulator [Zavarzinia compransoris]|uniref:Crp/Fnr family transcriptional regulator n=1 Tax=Zavarzinia compransoris TaxID=1264899 RepID=A0A317E9D6_9PROT|nr:Crp/Fnr family transcriptional regulator [Zavarzinia compransoris]PWR23509.1 Crp/Fnr family transcriptional regulator [Zavarzinia compransoris]TDP47720.1 Crp/Fnr family transcriptional regulator [Zavarzinia compransoris]